MLFKVYTVSGGDETRKFETITFYSLLELSQYKMGFRKLIDFEKKEIIVIGEGTNIEYW